MTWMFQDLPLSCLHACLSALLKHAESLRLPFSSHSLAFHLYH